MNKEEYIKRYGKAAWEKKLQQGRDWNTQHLKEKKAISKAWYTQHRKECNAKSLDWYAQHRDEDNARKKEWRKTNPKKVKAHNCEVNHKGGKYYKKQLEYQRTGLQRERKRIRTKHAKLYHPFKQITARDTQFHHEWLPGTAKYIGVALVEKVAHSQGFINVITVLEGEITLFTEKEIRGQVIRQ